MLSFSYYVTSRMKDYLNVIGSVLINKIDSLRESVAQQINKIGIHFEMGWWNASMESRALSDLSCLEKAINICYLSFLVQHLSFEF